MTPPLRSIVSVVRRLQDLCNGQAARRQALSRGRGLHATLPSALRVCAPDTRSQLRVWAPGYHVPEASGIKGAIVDTLSSIYPVHLIYVVLIPGFGKQSAVPASVLKCTRTGHALHFTQVPSTAVQGVVSR